MMGVVEYVCERGRRKRWYPGGHIYEMADPTKSEPKGRKRILC